MLFLQKMSQYSVLPSQIVSEYGKGSTRRPAWKLYSQSKLQLTYCWINLMQVPGVAQLGSDMAMSASYLLHVFGPSVLYA